MPAVAPCPPVALCPPAVRTLAVWAWADRDRATNEWETGFTVFPVLAISAMPDPTICAKPMFVSYKAVLIDSDTGCLTDTDDLTAVNAVWHLAAAPWPPEEDEERLATLLARVRELAIKEAERSERRSSQTASAKHPVEV